MLVTGFTAFGKFEVNPAEEIARRLAESLGARFYPLEVSYEEVDEFIDLLEANPPPAWLMVGVAGNAAAIRVETLARNVVGATPDVLSHVLGPRELSAGSPDLSGTLWPSNLILPPDVVLSDDAGDYLCNYVYFNALRRLPRTRCGFLHVLPTQVLPIALQVDRALSVLRQVTI